MARTLPCNRLPAVCCVSYSRRITSFFIGYGICRTGRASCGRTLGDAAERLSHLLPLRGRAHSHQFDVRNVQGQPAAAAVLYPQAGLRPTHSSPQSRFSPIPPGSRSSSVSMPPYPAPSPPICPCSSVPTKTVSPYSKRFPWHSPKRCLRRVQPHWRRMGNSVKPKHPPPLPNPFLRKPPTAIRHPADAAFRDVRPACRKPR